MDLIIGVLTVLGELLVTGWIVTGCLVLLLVIVCYLYDWRVQ